MVLLLVLAACAQRAEITITGPIPGLTQAKIPEIIDPAEILSTATASQEPYPVPPKSETATTPTPPPILKPTFTPSPFPILGEPEPTITPTRRTVIPGMEWKGPGVVYIKSSYFTLSNFDGSQKSAFGYVPMEYYAPDFSPETGAIVFESENSLWFIDQGKESQNILSLDQYIETPIITSDKSKIAYRVYGFDDEEIQQLWIINPDGTGNTMVSEDTRQYITDPGPFRLRPVAWSSDNTQVYMVTTTDSEATPTGMYVADLATGIIKKALTPQVTLWDVSFSPERTKIAYRTFQWIPVQNNMPEPGPPFTLNVTDLTTGAIRVLLESSTNQFYQPIWSRDGNRIAYATGTNMLEGDLGLFTIDLASGTTSKVVPGSDISRLRPYGWLSEDRLVYTEGDISTSIWNPFTTLYTISIDGADQHIIDSGEEITVLGVLYE
jgi:hypothetical protein